MVWSVYEEARTTLTTWYRTSPGVANLRKLVLENDYTDMTYEPRTKYQIDRYELWRQSTVTMTTLAGIVAAYVGWRAGTTRFDEVKELQIYNSRRELFKIRHSWQSMAALGYATPTIIRTFTMMTFLTGVPSLIGVYYNDTDYVSSYVISGFVGSFIVTTFMSAREFGGIRQKVVGALLTFPAALGLGIMGVMTQKYDVYINYDMYKARWRKIDPMWTDFMEKSEREALDDADHR